MTDKDQENQPKDDLENSENVDGADDDLEHLSSDERAAFEKIMAEIAVANGTAPQENTADAPGGSQQADTLPHDQPEAQAQESQDPAKVESTPSPTNASSQDMAENRPDGAQQAALEDTVSDTDALKGSGEGNETGDKDSHPTPNPENGDDDALTGDQEAALSQIMAEIEARKEIDKTAEPEKPEPEPEDTDADEDLSDDQEAALSQIMAEIEARKGVDKTAEPEKPEPDPEDADIDEDMSDDQEAALNKIMAEISTRKSGAKDNPPDEAAPSEGVDLSLDEFNQELNQLLSSDNHSQETPESVPGSAQADETKAAAAVDDEKDVNDTLKKIIGDQKPAADKDKDENAADRVDEDQVLAPAASGEPKAQASARIEDDYPILREINADEQRTTRTARPPKPKTPKTKPKRAFWPVVRKGLATATILTIIAVVSMAGYWAYQKNFAHGPIQLVRTETPGKTGDQPLATTASAHPQPEPQPEKTVQPDPTFVPVQPRQAPLPQTAELQGLVDDLAAARRQLLLKKSEIEDLKAYYQRGIEEEEAKIEAQLKGGTPPAFSKAMRNPKIELSLKAVQRRLDYIEKVENPLGMLFTASEELLFLQRRTQMYNTLIAHVSGFPLFEYQTEVKQIMTNYLDMVQELSVDEIESTPPGLETIWNKVTASLMHKASRKGADVLKNPRDRVISREICSGNFDQKYLLTELNPETARCLIKWGGHDLFLNELNHLSPEVAEILAQWPGAWLSLNGLKELSFETAAKLSAWPGKRLSLNGLTRISARTTDILSAWEGEQLELIGLQSMGRWENYGTRLYLSEKLQRELEGR